MAAHWQRTPTGRTEETEDARPAAKLTLAAHVLALQRTIGNRAVAGVLRQLAAGEQEQPSASPLAAIASALTQVGEGLTAEDPIAGAQFQPALREAADQLAGEAQPAAAEPAAMLSPAALMRQAAPAATAPAAEWSLPRMQKATANVTDLINNTAGKAYEGARGGEQDPIRWCALLTDWLHRWLKPALTQPLSLPAEHETEARAELELFVHRLAALRGLYNSMLPTPVYAGQPTGAESEGAMPQQARPDDPRRIQLAATGLADVGKVRSKDVDGDGRRIGWEQLKVVFDTAWPTHVSNGVPDSLIERKHKGKRLTPGSKKDPATDKYKPQDFYETDDVLPSWCGVGATYWAKKVDPGFPDWQMSAGVTARLAMRSKREVPQVGDLVIGLASLGHHGIITWVDPQAKAPKNDAEWKAIQIRTVESNMNNGQIVETPSGHGTLNWADTGVYDTFSRK